MSRPAPATPGNRLRRSLAVRTASPRRRAARPGRVSLTAAATAVTVGLGLALGGAAIALGGAHSGLPAVGRALPWLAGTAAGTMTWPSADAALATSAGGTVHALAEGGPGRPDQLLSWTTTAGGRPGTFSSVPVVAGSGTVAVTSAGTTATAAATTAPAPAAEPTPPSGLPHSVTIVLVSPPGSKRDGTTATELAAAVRGDVSRFWSSQTGGAVTFTVAKAMGWVKVSARCSDVWGLWSQAATASGFVPGLRKHLVVYVAPGGTCSPGLGTIGSGPEAGGYVYLRASKVALLAHELGHNLGLGHSNGLQCDGAADAVWSGRWSRPCTVSDYRDWYDVMGVSWDRLGTLSTAQAYRLGVLPKAQFTTLSGPGATTLRPVGSKQGVVSLRISDPAGVTYIVEYRPAAGSESWLGSRALDWRGLRPGVLIRRTDPTRGTDLAQTLLLDATPSRPAGYADDFDEPLTEGHTLTLGSGRVALKVVTASATSATVAVAMDGVWPVSDLARLGGRIPGAGSTVDPAPVAVPFVGPAPTSPR